jgi:trans-2,3-dihydro-3-hydroxyanthranilate isomerase
MPDRRTYRYRVVDVFTTRQFEGNPLAVFSDARGLADDTMQQIARELNLSESVFIFPASTDKFAARLRIFTPLREVPFAGHPTIGTSFVLFEERASSLPTGGFVLEEKIGPVAVRVEQGDPPMLWLSTPRIHEGRFFDRSSCATALGLTVDDSLNVRPQVVDAGNPTLFIALRERAAVDRASIDAPAIQALRGTDSEPCCVFVFAPTTAGAYSRMFAPEFGVREDPATGSATGPLAFYMMRNGLAPSASGTRLISEQGTKMGRRSFLHINIRGDMGSECIEVGGNVVSVANASMTLQE